MSCVQVMYQPYVNNPYLPTEVHYPRPGDHFLHHTKRESPKFKLPEPSTSVSPHNGSDGYGSSTATPGPTPGKTNTTTVRSSLHEERDSPPHKDVKYLSANCVVFTHYSGDTASEVDQHFSRALSYDAKSPDKDNVPMTQRNFPASFWNSNYHSRSTLTSFGHPTASHELYNSDPYHTAASLHGIHQSDPWHYSLTSQPYSHRPMADLGYSGMSSMPGAGRFNSQYGSLFFQSPSAARLSSMPSQCPMGVTVGKSDAWGRSYHHDAFTSEITTHPLETNFATAGAYSNMATGLESSIQSAGKDSYWI